MKPNILWEIIPDPFDKSLIEANNLDNPGEDILSDLDEGVDEFIRNQYSMLNKGVITQSGIIPLGPSWNPFKGFYGHCNFVITIAINAIIQSCEGVEAVKVLSPYRFKISFGKCWEGQEKRLQDNILNKIGEYVDNITGMSQKSGQKDSREK